MPSYTNHPKSHWYDAARMLKQAARRLERAADNHTAPGTQLLLQQALTNVNAALVRFQADTEHTKQ